MNSLLRGRFLKRTFSIKLLAIGWLVVAIFGGLRFAGSLSNWDLILSFGEPVLPLYLTISGFVWAIAGLVCACGLWLRHIWAGWLNV
ncbi:MAG TPA: hypothetical protein VN376_10500, partial [Longilinea sp.]|nr:hypothetical protein [Longilinea sp.]